MRHDDVTRAVIGAAIRVHRELGPGHLQSTCETCLQYELTQSGFVVERQEALPLIYKGVQLDCGYRMDLVVNNAIVVELNAIDRIERTHVASVLTYLKLSRHSVALLINFNVPVLRNGIHRLVL